MTRRVNPPKLGPKPEDLDWGLSKEAGGARRGCWGDATERQTPRRSCWSDEIPQASVQTNRPLACQEVAMANFIFTSKSGFFAGRLV